MMEIFRPINKVSRAELIAAQLRDLIFSGRIKPGEKLPPERELADRFKVNRTTLREALHKLEQLKLLFIRQGAGVEVLDYRRSPSLELLAYLLISNGTINRRIVANVLEARVIIGKATTELAADRIRPEHILQLEKIIADMENALSLPEDEQRAKLQELDFLFFEKLAEASENIVFNFLYNGIRDIYLVNRDYFRMLFPEPKELISNHREILAGVSTNDKRRAGKAAEEFLKFGIDAVTSGEGFIPVPSENSEQLT